MRSVVPDEERKVKIIVNQNQKLQSSIFEEKEFVFKEWRIQNLKIRERVRYTELK